MNAKQLNQRAYSTVDAVVDNPYAKLVSRSAIIILSFLAPWYFSKVMNDLETVKLTQVQFRTTIEELKDKANDRYTRSQADRDWAIQHRRDEAQDAAHERMDVRIDALQRFRGR